MSTSVNPYRIIRRTFRWIGIVLLASPFAAFAVILVVGFWVKLGWGAWGLTAPLLLLAAIAGLVGLIGAVGYPFALLGQWLLRRERAWRAREVDHG